MFAHLNSIGLYGMDAFEVNVEADISNGLPGFDVVGLPDTAVKESRDRVRSALKNCGFAFPMSLLIKERKVLFMTFPYCLRF